MTFVSSFYNLTVELQNIDLDLYAKFRVKTPRHPLETIEHLHARFLAFIHNYDQGLEFSQGLFEPGQPTIWKRDVIGEVLKWIQVGVPTRKQLEAAIHTHKKADFLIFLYYPEQIHNFLHEMRGSRLTPFSQVKFFQISEKLLEQLTPLESSSPVWNVTCIDNNLYIACNDVEVSSSIEEINMENAYQSSIGNIKEDSA